MCMSDFQLQLCNILAVIDISTLSAWGTCPFISLGRYKNGPVSAAVGQRDDETFVMPLNTC